MPKTSLLEQLRRDYPSLSFRQGDTFHWSPVSATVYYVTLDDTSQLLHETSHAILGHRSFKRDIQLLTMEHEAWEQAVKLAEYYRLVIPSSVVEDALDSYRDWLHARSTCPHCGMTGIQHAQSEYRCPACLNTWRVNDARVCGLRRTIQKSPV